MLSEEINKFNAISVKTYFCFLGKDVKFMWNFKAPYFSAHTAVTKIPEAGSLIRNRNVSLIDLEHRKFRVEELVDLLSNEGSFLLALVDGPSECIHAVPSDDRMGKGCLQA